jgi:hypothetical protein
MTTENTQTLPMRVKHVGFMLERLAKDCDDLQFLRELTQNSIESIQRLPKKNGQIIWDVDWVHFAREHTYKLCVTDTGDGMTGEEMIGYINNLSSSSSTQAHNANFGVGAKIAAGTRNPAGLLYLSWKKNAGHMIHFWRDPTSAEYGLKQFALPDESFSHTFPVAPAVKPEVIRSNGTKVILWGEADDSNTMTPPPRSPSPSRWITRYLNTRYFEFPVGITVKAREGWEFPSSDKNNNVLRTITGQKHYLDRHAECKGSVKLSVVRVHWWILQSKGITQNSGFIASSGHCAVLWNNELYEMTSGRGSTSALNDFGVVFGHQQVVLYVEPIEALIGEVVTNTSRTSLLVNGRKIPWSDWSDEFRKKMPEEIVRHMEKTAAASDATDHKESIRERLKRFAYLFKVSKYRATPSGDLRITGETQARQQKERLDNEKEIGGGGEAQKSSAQQQSLYFMALAGDSDILGKKVHPDSYPEVRWVCKADGTRAASDMEDRAAKYLEKDNFLFINADFRMFTDVVDRWVKEYAEVPGSSGIILDVVREWFEQELVEAVISAQTLRHSKYWTLDDMEKLLSEEALTAVVLPRTGVETKVKNTLRHRFGSPNAKLAA